MLAWLRRRFVDAPAPQVVLASLHHVVGTKSEVPVVDLYSNRVELKERNVVGLQVDANDG
ncbi:MAG: hypothetical protein ACI9KE_000876 [Polyangiales bacterium]|jgi:hypothetical protein